MQWGSVENFLNMGGYAFYVWSSYGVCVAIIVAEMLSLRLRRRRALDDLRRQARLASQRGAAA
jgi:heme exporter protein D